MGELLAFKRVSKAKTVKGAIPKRFQFPTPTGIPASRKGILTSNSRVVCPLCGSNCLGAVNIGRGCRKYPRFHLVCGDFSCTFEGISHGNHPLDWGTCPYCVQNPRKPSKAEVSNV